ncbi:MAG: YraN family protein [Candidatus Omnitrophica bacterium]|nr:YraN family protein [Candidatus Omnitrophota bacterium]
MIEPKESNQTTGRQGERIGEDYLKARGYQILERNVRSPLGEIDLVARHQDILVFVEIKTRRANTFGLPEESVDRRKRSRLIRLASWYLAQHPKSNPQVRFDILAIELNRANHRIRLIQDAFDLSSE